MRAPMRPDADAATAPGYLAQVRTDRGPAPEAAATTDDVDGSGADSSRPVTGRGPTRRTRHEHARPADARGHTTSATAGLAPAPARALLRRARARRLPRLAELGHLLAEVELAASSATLRAANRRGHPADDAADRATDASARRAARARALLGGAAARGVLAGARTGGLASRAATPLFRSKPRRGTSTRLLARPCLALLLAAPVPRQRVDGLVDVSERERRIHWSRA